MTPFLVLLLMRLALHFIVPPASIQSSPLLLLDYHNDYDSTMNARSFDISALHDSNQDVNKSKPNLSLSSRNAALDAQLHGLIRSSLAISRGARSVVPRSRIAQLDPVNDRPIEKTTFIRMTPTNLAKKSANSAEDLVVKPRAAQQGHVKKIGATLKKNAQTVKRFQRSAAKLKINAEKMVLGTKPRTNRQDCASVRPQLKITVSNKKPKKLTKKSKKLKKRVRNSKGKRSMVQPADMSFRSSRRRRVGLMIEWLLLAIPFLLQAFRVGFDADDVIDAVKYIHHHIEQIRQPAADMPDAHAQNEEADAAVKKPTRKTKNKAKRLYNFKHL